LVCLILLFVSLKTLFVNGTLSNPGPAQPNIVLVYADDLDCETLFGSFPQQEIASMRFENLQALALDGTTLASTLTATAVASTTRLPNGRQGLTADIKLSIRKTSLRFG